MLDRLIHAFRELGGPLGMAGRSSFAGGPVAGWEGCGAPARAGARRGAAELLSIVVVGNEVFGAAERPRRPRRESVQKPTSLNIIVKFAANFGSSSSPIAPVKRAFFSETRRPF